jgi:transcriptional regulator with XRE-family HTH domain
MNQHRHYLRDWRENRGLTQGELGAKIGSHKGVISRYETGAREPSFAVMFKLCEALGITVQQFFEAPSGDRLTALARALKDFARLPRRAVYVDCFGSHCTLPGSKPLA